MPGAWGHLHLPQTYLLKTTHGLPRRQLAELSTSVSQYQQAARNSICGLAYQSCYLPENFETTGQCTRLIPTMGLSTPGTQYPSPRIKKFQQNRLLFYLFCQHPINYPADRLSLLQKMRDGSTLPLPLQKITKLSSVDSVFLPTRLPLFFPSTTDPPFFPYSFLLLLPTPTTTKKEKNKSCSYNLGKTLIKNQLSGEKLTQTMVTISCG